MRMAARGKRAWRVGDEGRGRGLGAGGNIPLREMAESGLSTSQGQELLARSGFADKAKQRALIGDEIAL